MNSSEIELFTSQELIDELMRRSTFQGVIIHARDAVKSSEWTGERVFSVRHSSHLECGEAGRLLEVVSRRLTDADV